jgi:subtilisin-like proprotein convertase family protein
MGFADMMPGARIILMGCIFAVSSTAVLESGAATFTYSNTNFITLIEPESASGNVQTPASPYPSVIKVTGLTNQVVTKVTVTLNGFSHTFPSDVDILLVGPKGQMGLLMYQVGGVDEQFSVTNLTLTLDDDATNSMPVFTSLSSGTFKPTSARPPPIAFDFPAPAPPGNSNAICALSMFNGTDPRGNWILCVVDETAGDSGSISGGWSMDVSVGQPELAISEVLTNVVLSWPTNAQNFSLQSTPSLVDPITWNNLPTNQVIVSNRFTVTNTVLPGATFYRLISH